jgi:cytochrome c5
MIIRFMRCASLICSLLPSLHANTHHPQEFLQSIRGSKAEGEDIYQYFCSNCHDQKPLISLGAPKKGRQRDWVFRLKQGMPMLFKHTNEGLNAMPPRGGCFECTDEQLMLAIIAMLPTQCLGVGNQCP